MFIESSSPARKGWKAWLVSAQMPAGNRCMNVSYSMYGGGTGECKCYGHTQKPHK